MRERETDRVDTNREGGKLQRGKTAVLFGQVKDGWYDKIDEDAHC